MGRDGAAPFYTGEVAAAVIEWLDGRGAMLTAADLAAYRVVDREPVRVAYRGRDVVTNPPPSAGGTLIAYALALLERSSEPLSPARLVDVMAEPELREWGLRMVVVARTIERIGDRAVDIGEQTAYLLTAQFREFTDASHPG